MRSNTSIAPLASLAALARSLRSPTACCFSCGVVLFPVVSVKLPKSLKNLPPSFQNHPQNLPKSIRKPTKIRPKTLQKLGLEGIVLRIAFGPFFLSDLWASWAVSGASWDHLGAVLGRLAASWSRPGTTSGRSWAVLGASWGVLAHLGGVLGASWGILEAFRDNFHEEVRFLIDFCSQLRPPKPRKSLIFHWFYKHF